MVVCHYFLQGICKFGQHCRNEHPTSTTQAASNSGRSIFRERDGKIYEDLVSEVIASERGNQWPLSCFAPFREHSIIPNLQDQSPEELRSYYYDARKEGRIPEYVTHVTGLIKKSEEMRNFLKRPSVELGRLLEEIISNKRDPSLPSTSQFAATDNRGSIFGDASAPSQATAPPNIFGGNQVNIQAPNIFAGSIQAEQPPGSSIFGGAPLPKMFSPGSSIFPQPVNVLGASTQQTSLLGPPPTAAQSQNIFSSSQSSSQNIFAQQQLAFQNLFQAPSDKNIFQSQPSANPAPPEMFSTSNQTFASNAGVFSSNIFAPSTDAGESVFAPPPPKSETISTENVYSQMEELNEEEIAIYKAPMFTFGKIPLKPPPECFC